MNIEHPRGTSSPESRVTLSTASVIGQRDMQAAAQSHRSVSLKTLVVVDKHR